MGLMDILESPAVEALLPALLGGVGRGLSSPRLAGTRGAVGQGILGAGEGLSTGLQTAQQQQRLNMEQQQQPLKMDALQANVDALKTQNQQAQTVLANEQLTRQYGLSIKDPAEQARYFADPKAYMQRQLISSPAAINASLLALQRSGVSPAQIADYQKIGQADPQMLHDIAVSKATGKEDDLTQLAHSYMESDPKLKESTAFEQAATKLAKIKADAQVAVVQAREEAKPADPNKAVVGQDPFADLRGDADIAKRLPPVDEASRLTFKEAAELRNKAVSGATPKPKSAEETENLKLRNEKLRADISKEKGWIPSAGGVLVKHMEDGSTLTIPINKGGVGAAINEALTGKAKMTRVPADGPSETVDPSMLGAPPRNMWGMKGIVGPDGRKWDISDTGEATPAE